MYYNYDLIVVKPKLNKKKVIIFVLILFLIISLPIYAGIKHAEKTHNQKLQEEEKIRQQIEQEETQKREQELKQKELELEKERRIIKTKDPLTEEQLQSIENIYQNVGEKRVFLTFDDGPTTSVTPFILDLLKQENIKATFFVLGNRAKANPSLIKREFEEGHYIANHGYTHKYSEIYSKKEAVLDEYNYTDKYIQQALENPDYHSRIFRFPGGSVGGIYSKVKRQAKDFLKENNIASLDWNALSKDAEGANTKEKLLENVIETSKNKSSVVLLMHDAADKILTYETLPDIIKYFRDNGYEFKNIYDIL